MKVRVRKSDGTRETYRPTVLEVTGFDALGRPNAFRRVFDDETVDLRESSCEFWVVLASERVLDVPGRKPS